MALFAPLLNFLWTTARDLNLDADRLLEDAGIDPSLRRDQSARISADQFDQLISRIGELVNDDAVAFELARHIHPSNVGSLGYAWMTGATLRRGITRVAKYVHHFYREFAIEVVDLGDELQIEVIFGEEVRNPGLRETGRLALMVQLCRMTYGPRFAPSRMQLVQPTPIHMANYTEFFRCPLEFARDRTVIAIDSEVADEELPGFDPKLVTSFDTQLVEMAARVREGDIESRVRATILRGLPTGDVNFDRAAERLNMSHRTLARRLADIGASYTEILRGMREELATRYLRDRTMPLIEVALLLGFSDTSTFSRAFKSWTGKTPGGYRQEVFG